MKKEKINSRNEGAAAANSLPFDITSYFGQETAQKAAELYEHLQQPLMTAVQTGIVRRNLHNWVYTLGMNEGKDTTHRTKYSFTEFIWLKMIEQLREAGLSLSIIARLREHLFNAVTLDYLSKGERAKQLIQQLSVSRDEKQKLLALLAETNEKENTSFLLLDIMIVQSVIKREPIGMAVFLDGSFLPLEKDYQLKYQSQDLQRLFNETYTFVSISGIIKNFLRSKLAEWVVPKVKLLNPAENKLFELIRTGDYQSITIEFKDKKLNAIELKKSENIKDKIVDMLDTFEFGDITVKKHKGVVTKIESTKRIKL